MIDPEFRRRIDDCARLLAQKSKKYGRLQIATILTAFCQKARVRDEIHGPKSKSEMAGELDDLAKQLKALARLREIFARRHIERVFRVFAPDQLPELERIVGFAPTVNAILRAIPEIKAKLHLDKGRTNPMAPIELALKEWIAAVGRHLYCEFVRPKRAPGTRNSLFLEMLDLTWAYAIKEEAALEHEPTSWEEPIRVGGMNKKQMARAPETLVAHLSASLDAGDLLAMVTSYRRSGG